MAQTAPVVENAEVKQPDVKERLKKSLFGTPVSENSDEPPVPSATADEAGSEGPDESPQAQQDDNQPASQEPTHDVVINGETKSVPLSKLIASYQIGENLGEKSRTIASKEKELESVKGEVGTLRERMVTELEALSAAMQARLPTQQDIQRAVSEGRVADAMQMQLALQNHQMVVRRKEELSQQSEQERQAKFKEQVVKERTTLEDKLPEYKDEAAHKKLAAYLVKSGNLTEQEVDTLSDHRAIIIAHKAMKWDELQAKTPTVQKNLEAAPKLNKPSARQDGSAVGQERFEQAKKSLSQAGSVKNISSADRKALAKRLGLN